MEKTLSYHNDPSLKVSLTSVTEAGIELLKLSPEGKTDG